jgi:GTPase
MFVDQVRIFVRAGRGGDGSCHFRREKFVPRGGPDGGDGGHGGNVVITTSRHLNTLLELRYQKQYKAKAGGNGGGNHRHGRNGADVLIKVPVGTLIVDDATGDVLGDLIEDDQTQIVAHGGRGGRGNSHFATPTNRTPTQHEPGGGAEERWLRLELKLLADVGLVGLPNAGKSTLIASISAARPKIADYPFTTLTPNLGVVRHTDDHSFVVADIPGLITGAHEGKGLGFQFLRHVERTIFLLHLVDVSDWSKDDPLVTFEATRRELSAYNPSLSAKPFAIAGTKMDIMGNGSHWARLQHYSEQSRIPAFLISAVTREGLDALIAFLGQQVAASKRISCVTES